MHDVRQQEHGIYTIYNRDVVGDEVGRKRRRSINREKLKTHKHENVNGRE